MKDQEITTFSIAPDEEQEYRGSSGLKGMLENPYVLATALFASLGGVLFGV
jgi:hypothetical protein